MIKMKFFAITFIFFVHFQAYSSDVLSNPYFYSLTSPSGSVSHLLGTIHGGVSVDELPQKILELFDQARVFITEYRFNDEVLEALLNGHLVDQQLKLFKFQGEELSPIDRLNLIAVWGVDSRLAAKAKSEDCALLSFGGPIATGFMDEALQMRASKLKKPTESLDSDELLAQLKFQAPQPTCHLSELMTNWSPQEFRDEQLKLIQEYRSGVEPRLVGENEDDAHTEARNKAWLNLLLSEIEGGNAFIAVGEYHLFGNAGLLKLLGDHGYKVEKVKNAGR